MSQGDGWDWRDNKFKSQQDVNGIGMSEDTRYSETLQLDYGLFSSMCNSKLLDFLELSSC